MTEKQLQHIKDRFIYLDKCIKEEDKTDILHIVEYEWQKAILLDILMSLNIRYIPYIGVDDNNCIVLEWHECPDYKFMTAQIHDAKESIRISRLNSDGSIFNAIVKKGFVKDYIY